LTQLPPPRITALTLHKRHLEARNNTTNKNQSSTTQHFLCSTTHIHFQYKTVDITVVALFPETVRQSKPHKDQPNSNLIFKLSNTVPVIYCNFKYITISLLAPLSLQDA
jgi:hypothetical protein